MSEQGTQTELKMGQPAPSTEQPATDSAPVSFRDRTMQRLNDESRPNRDDANYDGPPSNLPQVELTEQEAPQDAHQPDDGYPEESGIDPLFDEGPTQEVPEAGVENSNVEDVFDDVDVGELRQRAEKAESLYQSMQTDYTQKTQKLGESRRELEASLGTSAKISEVYAQRANANLARYNGVNWQQQQSTLDPQTYNQRVAEYRQAVQLRDHAVSEHAQIAKFASEQTEKQRQNQAEDSRDILRNTIPGWGEELYRDLRDFAVSNLALTEQEFGGITDHRYMRMFHDLWKVSNTGGTVRGIQQQNTQSRPSGQNRSRTSVRGADGRFRKAQENHERNPGDRNATREMFATKLARERGVQRR